MPLSNIDSLNLKRKLVSCRPKQETGKLFKFVFVKYDKKLINFYKVWTIQEMSTSKNQL